LTASAALLLFAGCGGQLTFAGDSALSVAGDPPPPPPAPPPPKEEPPPPPPARVEVRDNKIEIREKIQFDHAKATIKEESHDLLNEIVDVIKKNPHIKKISIEGHASAEGDPGFNKRLSGDRAKSVMAYLVEKGIPKEALVSKGFGVEKPIASNDTEEGREKNRRVEFNIIEQDVTQKKIQVDPNTGKEKVLEEKPVGGESKGAEDKAEDKPEGAKPKDKPALGRPKTK
jgi:OOP family OmpA-OmpF porin